MKNKALFGFLALFVIGILTTGFVSAFGFGNGPMGNLSEEEMTEMQAYHESIREAIQNNDYESWRSLMESKLTQEEFDLRVEHHNQMMEMRDLREQLREAYEVGDDSLVEKLQEELSEFEPMAGFGMGRHGMGDSGMNMKGECPFAGEV